MKTTELNIFEIDGEAIESKFHRYAIPHFKYDAYLYRYFGSHYDLLHDAVLTGLKEIETFHYLAYDLFFALYKERIELRSYREMFPPFKRHLYVVERLINDRDFQEIREYTRLNGETAMLFTPFMCYKAIDHLRYIGQYFKKNPAKADLKTVKESLEKSNHHKEQMNRKEYECPGDDYEQDQNEHKGVEQTDHIFKSWGYGKGNPQLKTPRQEQHDLLLQLMSSPKFRAFTDQIGKMKETISKIQEEEQNGVCYQNITFGNQLQNILPSEKMQLGHPILKKGIYKRFYEKKLLQYHKKSFPKKRGPIICCVDCSSSMEGKREAWAKAVALGLLEMARQQKRSYACILFDEEVDNEHIFEAPEGVMGIQLVTRLTETFPGGGTNFERPLSKALSILQKNRFQKGDVVLITDGFGNYSQQFHDVLCKAKREKQFKIYGISLELDYRKMLEKFSDEVILLQDFGLQSEQITKEIIEKCK